MGKNKTLNNLLEYPSTSPYIFQWEAILSGKEGKKKKDTQMDRNITIIGTIYFFIPYYTIYTNMFTQEGIWNSMKYIKYI